MTRFKRFRNLKVYYILNIAEILFWFVVVIISFMGASRYCKGAYCGLTVVVALVALVLT